MKPSPVAPSALRRKARAVPAGLNTVARPASRSIAAIFDRAEPSSGLRIPWVSERPRPTMGAGADRDPRERGRIGAALSVSLGRVAHALALNADDRHVVLLAGRVELP
jgi:hypothetical protein